MAQERLAAEPGAAIGYSNLTSAYFLTGRFPEAESTLQRASERKLENPELLLMRYHIAVLTGDRDQMDRVMALAKGKRGAEHRMAHAQSLALARSGPLEAAHRSSARAPDLARQEGGREAAATYPAARAVWEAVCGNTAEATRDATGALNLSKGRDVEYMTALGLALSGDFSRSEALAGDLEKRLPEDTFVRFTYVPVLRALAELGRGKARRRRGARNCDGQGSDPDPADHDGDWRPAPFLMPDISRPRPQRARLSFVGFEV